jgi:hypothetical protein
LQKCSDLEVRLDEDCVGSLGTRRALSRSGGVYGARPRLSVVMDLTVARARRQRMGVEYLRVIFVMGQGCWYNVRDFCILVRHGGPVAIGDELQGEVLVAVRC